MQSGLGKEATLMRIQFENVDLNSRSGPNGFGLKLARQFMRDGHELTNDQPDVRLSFIQSMNNLPKHIQDLLKNI